MATVTCTNCGAVMKTANPIAPGKKVKCPKCAQAFVVQEEEEKKPAAQEAVPSAADEAEDDDLDFGDKPKAKKNGKASDDDDEGDDGKKKKPAKKGGMMLYILLALGGVGLLSCCGGGGWWYYANFYSKPAFVGSWEKKTEKGAAIPIEFLISFENNNTGRYDNFADQLTGKHVLKLIDEKTVEITMNDVQVNSKETNKLWTGSFSGRFTFTVAGDDLTLVNTADQKSTKLKRK